MTPIEHKSLGLEQSGDEFAFEVLVGPLILPAYALACGLIGNGPDAEEAVQAAALRTRRNLSRMRKSGALRRSFFELVVRESQTLRLPDAIEQGPADLELLMRAALDSNPEPAMDPHNLAIIDGVLSETRRRQSDLPSRRIRGHAITAAALLALVFALMSGLTSPTSRPTANSSTNGTSRPVQLTHPVLLIPVVPPPSTTGPCAGAGGTFPYGGPACVYAGAEVGIAYPILWYDHCGLWPWTEFNGTRFYVASLDPSTVDEGLGGGVSNFIPGTMTLTSPHHGLFRDHVTGRIVEFVDTLPGQVGKPYRFHLEIYPNWRQLDTTFAGRLWTSGPVPPEMAPPASSGSGPPARIVLGTLTLVSDAHAAFAADGGGRLDFSVANPMCA